MLIRSPSLLNRSLSKRMSSNPLNVAKNVMLGGKRDRVKQESHEDINTMRGGKALINDKNNKKGNELSQAVLRFMPRKDGNGFNNVNKDTTMEWVLSMTRVLDAACMRIDGKPELAASQCFTLWKQMQSDEKADLNNKQLLLQLMRACVMSNDRSKHEETAFFFEKFNKSASLQKPQSVEDKQLNLLALIELMKSTIKLENAIEAQRIIQDLWKYDLDARTTLPELKKNVNSSQPINFAIFQAMSRRYQDLYESCIECLCKTGEIYIMRLWYNEMIRLLPSCLPSSAVLHKMFDACIEGGNSKFGLEILTLLQHERSPQAIFKLDKLLQCSIEALDSEVSLTLIKMVCEKKGTCDQGSALQLLNLSSYSGDAVLAEYVWNNIIEWKHTISTDHCLAYLKALARGSKDETISMQAIHTLANMGLSLDIRDLQDLSSELSTSVERIDKAYFACESIAKDNDKKIIHIDAMNTVLLSCAQIGDISRAISTFESIKTLCQSSPTNISYVALLKCAAHPSCLDLNVADNVIQLVSKNNIAVDEVFYESLILLFSRSGQLEKALNCLEECIKSGFIPTNVTFDSLIRKLARQERIQDSLNLLEGMNSVGRPVQISTKKYLLKMSNFYGLKFTDELKEKVGI